MERNFKGVLGVCFFYVVLFFPNWTSAQNFNKSKYEKEYFYSVGLGVGNFFSEEQGSDVNSKFVPTLSMAFGKRMGGHFGLKSTVSIQPFSVEKPEEPFKGLSYAMDLMPSVNLYKNKNQLDLPKINVEFGMGLGFMINYVSKDYDLGELGIRKFQYLEYSPYIPARLAINMKFKGTNTLGVEGVFFNTWLGPEKQTLYEIKKNANQFGQINLVMRRFVF
jgi:hypothetical protein